jgi:glutathione S-transferase
MSPNAIQICQSGRGRGRRGPRPVARLEQAFGQARREFGQAGAFLFGDFSAADAMFAPVVNRLHAYKVAVTPGTRAYMDAIMALSAWQDWSAQAQAETWIIDKYEIA